MGRATRARRERQSRPSTSSAQALGFPGLRRPAGPAPSRPGVLAGLPRAAARLALAALLLAGAGTFAAPASADVLVSNIGQTQRNSQSQLSNFDLAQGFTTGSKTSGYTLTSVEVHFEVAPGSTSTVTVKLTEGSLPTSTNTPDTVTLTNPGSWSSGNNTFTAPSDTTLDASTTYFVVLEGDGGALDTTSSDSEDSEGQSGWSVGNTSRYRSESSTGSWSSQNTKFLIRINGAAKSDISVSPATVEVDEGSTATYTVALSGAPTADVTVAVASGDTGAATVAPSSLTFTTANWDDPQEVTVTGVEDSDRNDESR